jgi:hypothetical protein
MLGRRLLSRRSVFTHAFAYRARHPYLVRLIVIAASGRRASTIVAVRPRPPKLTPASRHRPVASGG